MNLLQRPRIIGVRIGQHVNAVLSCKLQLGFSINLVARRDDPRGNLRTNAIDALQLIPRRSEHGRRRTKPRDQRLPQQRPNAGYER